MNHKAPPLLNLAGRLFLCLLLGLSGLIWASAKSEDALRAELAKTQAALAALQAAQKRDLKKLGADNLDRAAAAADTAAVNAAAAQSANAQALKTAGVAKTQSEQLMRVSQHSDFANYATLITTVSGFFTLLASFFWKAYTDARDHRWLVEANNRAEMRLAEVAAKVTVAAKVSV
jgi:hypothetical protein